jgi:hypothetical protein
MSSDAHMLQYAICMLKCFCEVEARGSSSYSYRRRKHFLRKVERLHVRAKVSSHKESHSWARPLIQGHKAKPLGLHSTTIELYRKLVVVVVVVVVQRSHFPNSVGIVCNQSRTLSAPVT